MHGLAVVNKINSPTFRKMATTAPHSCATNWFFGFARKRYPVFKSPVMSVDCAAEPAAMMPAVRLTVSAGVTARPAPLPIPPKMSCDAFATAVTGFTSVVPADCTPTKENAKPSVSERSA